MATTSGTATFNYNRNQIIFAALRKIGAFASGETPDNQTVQDCADQLNIMVKAWDATGLHIWTETEATLFLQPGQVSYLLGANSPDNATESYTATTAAGSYSSGATSVVLTSAAGIASGYYIGIQLTAGSIFWTTVNGAPSGNTVTLTTGLSGSVAAGTPVYFYQTQIIRPLRVLSGRRYVFSSGIDTPMITLSRLDYRNLPNKTTTGTITQFFYDPRGGSNAQGIIYVWPASPDVSSGLKFTWMRPLQDFSSAANIPDLPNEWLNALIWNLALQMAPEYDCPPVRYQMLEKQAGMALDLVMGWDREPESIYFGVNFDQR